MPRVPEHHCAGVSQQCPVASLHARCDLAQIGEPHHGSFDTRSGQRRGMQHVERRFDR